MAIKNPGPSNPVTSTGSIDVNSGEGVGDDSKPFPTSERGGEAAGPRSVKAEYEALIRAAAPNADLGNVLSVTLANGQVRVEYVDRSQASEFEPDPIRISTASAK